MLRCVLASAWTDLPPKKHVEMELPSRKKDDGGPRWEMAALLQLLLAAGANTAAQIGETSLLAAIDHQQARHDGAATVSVGPRLGVARKHPSNPLIVQDRPWEPHIDNGYPSLVAQPDAPAGSPRFLLFYDAYTVGEVGCSWTRTAPYAGAPPPCSEEASLLAESSDGLTWTKPSLGRCPWPPGSNDTANNIIKCPWHDDSFENPVSVFRDTGPHAPVAAGGEPPVLTSFGMWGSKPMDSREGNCGWNGWVTRSYDGGRTFRNLTQLLTEDPACQGGTRYDTQPGLFFDTKQQRCVQ